MIIFYKPYSNISLALIRIIMVHYLTIFLFSFPCNWTARLTMSLSNTDELIIMIFRLLEKHGMLHVQLSLWECIWLFRIHDFSVDFLNFILVQQQFWIWGATKYMSQIQNCCWIFLKKLLLHLCYQVRLEKVVKSLFSNIPPQSGWRSTHPLAGAHVKLTASVNATGREV